MWPFKKKNRWYTEPGKIPLDVLPAYPGAKVVAVIFKNSNQDGEEILTFQIRKEKERPKEEGDQRSTSDRKKDERTYVCTFLPEDLDLVRSCVTKSQLWYRKMKKAGLVN